MWTNHSENSIELIRRCNTPSSPQPQFVLQFYYILGGACDIFTFIIGLKEKSSKNPQLILIAWLIIYFVHIWDHTHTIIPPPPPSNPNTLKHTQVHIHQKSFDWLRIDRRTAGTAVFSVQLHNIHKYRRGEHTYCIAVNRKHTHDGNANMKLRKREREKK